VLAKWAAATDAEDKFSFLKEWVADPRFGRVTVTESRRQITTNHKSTDYGWYTRGDVYARYSGWASDEAKEYCEKLIKGAGRWEKHPEKQHRKDKTMRVYRMLKSVVEGIRKENHGDWS
jgi:hypothetical protein